MTNEQMLNAMIPGALKRLEDAGSHEYIGATAMVSASDLRVLLAHVAALKADAERMRWLLDGNGYFMKNEMLCGHGPCSEENKNSARAVIDAAMNGVW